MIPRSWQDALLTASWLLAVLALAYGPDRTNSLYLLGFGVLAFLAYGLITVRGLSWKWVLVSALLVRILVLWADVGWTDDHFRYVYDGGITAGMDQGESVYATTPEERASRGDEHAMQFLPLLNHSDTYTVYPPFAQMVFTAAYTIGSYDSVRSGSKTDIDGVVRSLRVLILVLEMLSFLGLLWLLGALSLPRNWLAWYALNPLVIMEFGVNVHTEVFMVTWCVLFLVAVHKKRFWISGIFLGLAVAAKLWPLLFFPLLWVWLGLKRAMLVGGTALLVFAFTWIPFFCDGMFEHVYTSIRLYFSYFEFNSSLYYLIKWLLPDGWVKGSSLIALLSAAGVLWIAWLAYRSNWRSMPEGMLWTMLVYLAFASTVHPWYIIPLLAFAALTRYRWPFIWSLLVLPTYLTYAELPYEQPFWWIWVEYLILALVIALELMVHTIPAMRRRADMKVARLINTIPLGANVLDIGTGNGALANALIERGVNVTSVDVVDKSRFSGVRPTLIDGKSVPFEDNAFDMVLIITVLHHTKLQRELLTEASRVGKELVIMEDVYRSSSQRYLTYLFDSLINLEFVDHPRTNRNEEGWEELFHELTLRVKDKSSFRTMLLFRQVIYRLVRA